MPEASLIRTVRFRASHRYRRVEWSEERNRRTFGPSAKAHAHDWSVVVTVRGEVNPETGFCVDLMALDRVLKDEVVEPLEGREVTEALPEFALGGRIPTTEELARFFFGRLRPRIPGGARLVRVAVRESEVLAAAYPPEGNSG